VGPDGHRVGGSGGQLLAVVEIVSWTASQGGLGDGGRIGV
jgi:hypothetical protein